MRFWCLLFIFCLSLVNFGTTYATGDQNNQKRVIYVTFDGVRWQDIFLTPAYFPRLWSKLAPKMEIYGMPGRANTMEVASVPVSLPSYQSQMAGEVTACQNNDCGRITVETFPEKLITTFGFAKKDVVTFASWWHIGLATEHVKDTTYTNAGNLPVVDPETGKPDHVMAWINYQQKIDHPNVERYPLSRYDRYTFAHAMHYLETFQPRFLWISLVEADEAAHINEPQYYYAMLNDYDIVLDELFMRLEKLGLDKNTMVIITTDHGRGDGSHWTDHGPQYPESKRTWAFVYGGKLEPVNEGMLNAYNTLAIRPTIEKYLIP